MAVGQTTPRRLNRRYREQARSHRVQGVFYPSMVIITLADQGHLYPATRQPSKYKANHPGPALAQARHRLSLPGFPMKYIALPFTWFVLLSCVVALASSLSLSLV
jgi:hypothetical protein